MPATTTPAKDQKSEKRKKTRGFFAWARRGKQPVEVEAARRKPSADGGSDLAVATPDSAEDSQKVTIQQLKQGYGEVLETMKSVRSHMDDTAERSRQMLEVMETLPQLLREIPEATRAQSAMLELINQHLKDQGETHEELTDAVRGLTAAAGTQGQALDGIREHLADGGKTREQLNQTLGDVARSSTETRESIAGVVEQSRTNDQRMREMYQRNQRVNTTLMTVCLVLAIGALALGGYVAWTLSQMGG